MPDTPAPGPADEIERLVAHARKQQEVRGAQQWRLKTIEEARDALVAAALAWARPTSAEALSPLSTRLMDAVAAYRKATEKCQP